MNLRARSARPGGPHRPKIVLLAAAPNPLLGDAPRAPEVVGLVVVLVDRDEQALRRKIHDFGEEGPGGIDGFCLEVVAEREVAQHFEERVVACGETDVLQVVVLA